MGNRHDSQKIVTKLRRTVKSPPQGHAQSHKNICPTKLWLKDGRCLHAPLPKITITFLLQHDLLGNTACQRFNTIHHENQAH